jgi:5-deoxy-glucuronate isomerase
LLYITATVNGTRFAPRLYLPYECQVEYRNEGTMQGTGTRIVRTVFNKNNAPGPTSSLAKTSTCRAAGRATPRTIILSLNLPLSVLPSQGFGMTALGTEAYQLHDRDTLLITDNKDHPQVAAPGYTMWYLWVIRHIEGNPYISPEFNPDHVWVDQPGAKIWDMKRTGR